MERNVNNLGLSRFVLGFLVSFIIAIYLGDKLVLPLYLATIIIVVMIVAGYFLWRNKIALLVLISLGAFVLGLAFYHFYDNIQNQQVIIYNQKIQISGVVKQIQPSDKYQQLVVGYNNTKILVQAPMYPKYQYGDKLSFLGEIQDPKTLKFKDFDYGNYLLKHGIRGLVKNPENIVASGFGGNRIAAAIFKVGDSFQTTLNKLLPEPMSTLMIGLIVGLKQDLPDSVTSAFQRTGLSHVTAVSGYNVTIIIIWISFLLMLVSRKISFVGTILATVIFVIISGASASVIRAGILAILVLSCKNIGRRPYYPILILFVAFVMLLVNPYALKNDISFQLSFLAFVGLLMLSEPIANIKSLQFIPESFRKVVAETLGAQILVLPILIYNFGIVSIIAPLANVLVLPAIPFTMLLGFITGIGGMIYYEFGKLLADLAWVPLKYILVVVENFSKLSWAAVSLNYKVWWWIPLYYLAIWIIVKTRTNETK